MSSLCSLWNTWIASMHLTYSSWSLWNYLCDTLRHHKWPLPLKARVNLIIIIRLQALFCIITIAFQVQFEYSLKNWKIASNVCAIKFFANYMQSFSKLCKSWAPTPSPQKIKQSICRPSIEVFFFNFSEALACFQYQLIIFSIILPLAWPYQEF